MKTAEMLAMQQTFVVVLEEINRARAKFPKPTLTMIALMEEVGEVAQAIHDKTIHHVNEELIQVMCLCMRIIYEGDLSTNKHRIKEGLGVLGLTKQHLKNSKQE